MLFNKQTEVTPVTMQARIETAVGHNERKASDIEMEVARRIGELVEAAVLNSTALASLPALDTPKKYPFSFPDAESGVTLFVTVRVDRDKAFKVLWDIITEAKRAVHEQATQELKDALTEGAELFALLENGRGLRPAGPYDRNELRLSWGEGGPPEERQRG